MQIVEALAEAPDGVSLVMLAERLAIPKTSLLNHLRVMVDTGHVAVKDARYVVGPSAIRLGTIIVSAFSRLASMEPVAIRLAQDSGETAFIAMLDERSRQAFYIHVVEGVQQVRYLPATGTRRPLYCTAVGRALLAFQGDAYIRAYLRETTLERATEWTVTSRAKLMKILESVRAERLAVSSREYAEDVGGIASPVFDHNGQVSYAISVSGPQSRLEADRSRLIGFVRAAAEEASWALGARSTNSRPTSASIV